MAFRGGRGWIYSIAVAFLISGCIQETARIESVASRPRGLVAGPPLGTPPRILVILYQEERAFVAEAVFLGRCGMFEVVETNRVRVQKTEITAVTVTVAAVLMGAGMLVYLLPDTDAGPSAVGGTALVAVGGIAYGIPKALEGESRESMHPEATLRPAPSTDCVLRPIAHERIAIHGAGATLEATSDSWGRAVFDGTVSGPVKIFISGRPADHIVRR
jgi:hypothetical protein